MVNNKDLQYMRVKLFDTQFVRCTFGTININKTHVELLTSLVVGQRDPMCAGCIELCMTRTTALVLVRDS